MSKANVAGFVFPSFNSTEGIAVELYLSGCAREPKCDGCHNQLLWDFNYGTNMTLEDIVLLLETKYKDADAIAIMGGEPLNQPYLEELLELLYNTGLEIWLYTSYELHEVPESILSKVDYIKTGRYIQAEHCNARLSSKNQKIYKANDLKAFEIFYEYNEN
jgi:anaerobic ribonucleoside-triphosphate reductase activating protein